MRIGVIQTNASDAPMANLSALLPMMSAAQSDGAQMVCTPEVTNIISSSRTHQSQVLMQEQEDPTLAAIRDWAAQRGCYVLIGSLAIKLPDDPRFANRSFLIGPTGNILARYDKIHMFRADLPGGETYDEAKGYRPGDRAVIADLPDARLGMTICYDMRFPHIYRDLAQAGADLLSVPSAFTVPTGKAHWHVLLRARAIETGCFIIAPAQTGQHQTRAGAARRSYGHSLVVDPWGEVLMDLGTDAGFGVIDLDWAAVQAARDRVPAINHNSSFEKPNA